MFEGGRVRLPAATLLAADGRDDGHRAPCALLLKEHASSSATVVSASVTKGAPLGDYRVRGQKAD